MLERHRLLAALTLAAAMSAAPELAAQGPTPSRPIELGFDAALAYETTDDVKGTSFSLPISKVRAGFFLGDAISLEPSLSLRWARTTFENPLNGQENTVSGWSYDVDVGLLYHFTPDRTRSQTFLRPFVGMRGFSGEDESGSQASLGAALGMKFPAANRLGTRLELGFAHRLEDEPEFQESNQIFVSFGFSFFTR